MDVGEEEASALVCEEELEAATAAEAAIDDDEDEEEEEEGEGGERLRAHASRTAANKARSTMQQA